MMRQTAVIENTASAVLAAIDGNYAIECDVQISADGEAMVLHDDELGPPDGRARPGRRHARGRTQTYRRSRTPPTA